MNKTQKVLTISLEVTKYAKRKYCFHLDYFLGVNRTKREKGENGAVIKCFVPDRFSLHSNPGLLLDQTFIS